MRLLCAHNTILYITKNTKGEVVAVNYKALDYDNLVALFKLYTSDKNTRVPSMVGFKAWMLTVQNYPAWMVQELTKQINKDVSLRFHLNTIIEANLVEGAVLGLYKGDTAKFLLKNNHGYKDSPNKGGGSTTGGTKQIVFKPAVKPAGKLEAPNE